MIETQGEGIPTKMMKKRDLTKSRAGQGKASKGRAGRGEKGREGIIFAREI